jgi:prepilin-type N-terminal cleavage/methylation domain-containing protein
MDAAKNLKFGPNRPRGASARLGPRSRAAGGYTLLEILIAMSIFAVGFLSVGAMLPVAVIEQRRTMDDLNAQELARTALMEVRTRKLTMSMMADPNLSNALNSNGHTNLADLLANCATAKALWPPAERSLRVTGEPLTPSTTNVNARRFFWYPMIRQVAYPPTAYDWQMVIFIVRRDYVGNTLLPDINNFTTYDNNAGQSSVPQQLPGAPGPCPTAGLARFIFTYANANAMKTDIQGRPTGSRPINAGDWIADDLVGIYRVAAADDGWIDVPGTISSTPAPTAVYYYPSQLGKPSPTMRIVSATDVVAP